MNYPLISEYIEAIKSTEDNFNKLSNLRPVLDDDGQPVMSSGNYAVVFKMRDEQTGKLHAVKCFLKEQEGRSEAYRLIAEELEFVNSTYLTPIKYLERELLVDTNNSEKTEFPVLLMDWVEGLTLDKYIREHIDNQYDLAMLAYQFSRLAMWLMPQPFAHGDLKPDNILVKDDGTLVLVDYDGMYVPAMKGQKARELGNPDFRHPSRTENLFNEHIDDFSLVSILLSLKAISLNPKLLEQYGAIGRLLLSEIDYRNLSGSQLVDALRSMMNDKELAILISLFILSASQSDLSNVSFKLLNLSRPDIILYMDNYLSSEVTNEDREKAWTDEYGAMYSADKQRLIRAPHDIKEYSILDGTIVVCDNSFSRHNHLTYVNIPNSVKIIGKEAFYNCSSLKAINLPGSIEKIKEYAFSNCHELSSIILNNGIKVIGKCAFIECEKVKSINIPNSVVKIEDGVFSYCSSLKTIIVDKDNKIYDSRNNCNAIIETSSNRLVSGCGSTIIPENVLSIGNLSFQGCAMLKEITIPQNVKEIGIMSFDYCYNLYSIKFPSTLEKIGALAFWRCESLEAISLPENVKEIGVNAFWNCTSLNYIFVDNNNRKYDSRNGCNAIIESETNRLVVGCFNSIIPNDIITIGRNAFTGCKLLKSLSIPSSVIQIEKNAFQDCVGLSSITLPVGLEDIGDYVFDNCQKLSLIEIPKGCKKIGQSAFGRCSELETVSLPNSIVFIDSSSFNDCPNLKSIVIPKGTREKFEKLLPKWKNELVESSFGLELKESLYTEVKQCAYKLYNSINDKELKELDKDFLLTELTILSSAIIEVLNYKEIFNWCGFVEKKILNEYLSINGVNDYDYWIGCNTAGMYMDKKDIYFTDNAISLAEFEKENGYVKFYYGEINAYPYDDKFWGEFIDKNGNKRIIYVDQGFPFVKSELLRDKQGFGIVEEQGFYYSDAVVYCLKEILKPHSLLPSYIKSRLSFYKEAIELAKQNQRNIKALFQIYNAVTNQMFDYSEPFLGIENLEIDHETFVNSITGETYHYNATILNAFSSCIWECFNLFRLKLKKLLLL